ncbi:DUF4231 domain-containing protein [Phytohabitans rumicis]|uniref:DUF4231 domain-containing protein n=1 Tax=Phytohabitans rumicis TaxID=1076125 RepID=A0A6V8LMG0_9ACTN|nr:DUF4231 domain-containing protein [Phytohabitans rumicis]GFJ95287.1 hypothetical protein Prum_089290 [Phytohabitans rumicis]
MPGGDLADFPDVGQSPAELLLVKRFRWYSRQATKTRLGYLAFGLAQLSAALVIAASVAFSAPRWFAPVLGAGIAFLEGARGLLRIQDNYPAYRAAAEELRNEGWLFAQRAGPYADANSPEVLLAERVVEISTRENTAWASAIRRGDTAGNPA